MVMAKALYWRGHGVGLAWSMSDKHIPGYLYSVTYFENYIWYVEVGGKKGSWVIVTVMEWESVIAVAAISHIHANGCRGSAT